MFSIPAGSGQSACMALLVHRHMRFMGEADGARETGVYTRVHEDFEHRPTQ